MSHSKLADLFNEWASDGRDEKMERDHGNVSAQVLEQITIRPGEQILDLGCGNGWATRILGQAAPGATAVGVDVSPKMIARAEELHSNTIRARYEVGTFEALDFPDNKFNRAFSVEALYYAVDLDKALAELFRVLKPGSEVDVVIDYYEENEGAAGWPDACGLPLHNRSAAGWQEAFEKSGFSAVRTERVRDSRSVEDSFEADCCAPDLEAFRAQREAGSLWIHALKPKA